MGYFSNCLRFFTFWIEKIRKLRDVCDLVPTTFVRKVFHTTIVDIVKSRLLSNNIPQKLESREDKNLAFVGKVGVGTRAILSARASIFKEFISWALVLWGLSPFFVATFYIYNILTYIFNAR